MTLLLVLLGCNATCSQTCKRLVECDAVDTTGVERDRCEEVCQEQQDLYDYWDDEDLQDRFDENRNCIRDATCAEIDDGVCYDEELFAW
ncbi:MAG: hypothetical protein GY913_02825 [Proteobacteria bacterium]|nr:hypothetical protein [Pseudomonadota bacterium]MCP4915832.1 hypothetical protein [Pseudomonadota bacterium]